MKKPNKLVVFVLFIFLIQTANAQPWMENIKSQNPNFFEIKKAFNDYWKDKTPEKGQGYKQFKRWEWFWEQRVGKNGEFPKSTVLWDEYEKYIAEHANQKLISAISGTMATWTFKGPNSSAGGYSGLGRINCIAFHPTIANTFWVGTPAGGLWKTIDGGATWSTNTDNLPVLGISDIAIDPTNANIMYIATGDGDAALSLQNGFGDTKSIGVLKSTNGGLTWSAVLTASVTQNILIRRLLINPTNPQILLAATSVGIWRTNDGGTTWNPVTSTSLWFIDMEFKPTDPNYVYATTYSSVAANAQIYTSTNNGLTWSQTSSFSGYNRVNVAVSANSPSLVDALCSNGSGPNYNGLGGLWWSSNNGASFSQYFTANCTNNLLHACAPASFSCGGQGSYDLAYAINPTNANEIWIGGVNTWRSINGGANWSINNYWSSGPTQCGTSPSVPIVHADKHFIAYHPLNNAFIYECNDGGLYVTNNSGTNWFDITNGMGISQIYRLGTSATVTNNVICGLQDNGSKQMTGSTWFDRTGGDGMECLIDYTNSNIQYASYVQGLIYKTTNNWSSAPTTIVSNTATSGVHESGEWVTPFIMHPTNNNTMLVGKAQVYQTTNGGGSWSQLGTLPSATGNIISMAYAPSNPNVIYVATASEFYKSINGGSTWTLMGTSVPRMTYIAVDPTNSQRVWQTNSNYYAADKVWYTPDGGTTWINFSGSLPNIPINCIVYQNGSADGLYIGTDLGVYYRDATMSDWIPYNTGLPNVIVNELEISYNNNKLWAATFGRGLWNSDLYCATPSQPSTISGANSLCAGSGSNSYSVAPVSGATSYSWSLPGGWSGSSTTNVINVIPNSTGILTVSAVNSCGAGTGQTLNITINPQPTISVNSGSICLGQSFTMSPSGASTYTFSSGSSVVSPTTNTNYTVTGSSSIGCVSTTGAISSIIVNPAPTANAGTSQSINCVMPSVSLNGSGLTTYTWSGPGIVSGGNTPNPTVNAIGTYSLIGSSGGCNSINTATVLVTANMTPPNLTITATSNTVCAGNSVTISVSGANTYSWSTGSTNSSITVAPTISTNYIVTGTNSINGCSNSTNNFINVNPLPTINANTSNSIICGPPFQGTSTLTANGATTYTWNPGGTGSSIVVSPSVSVTYSITGMDSNGCINYSTITQTVSTCTELSSINSVTELVKIYPNPFNGIVNISSTLSYELNIEIFNTLGSLVYHGKTINGKLEINLSQEASGIYFVRFPDKNNIFTIEKIIKQ